eukprot:CAMPEP_0170509810 /NCGR_PEP_ID=MMETSP0208-20121228/65419_1 /TAXON_ID=197538 /ORGANISM="Strombidium inclinatum, Strain S3" /LENGTH=168 /DNA_ID=CAMNT_0010793209 /DNA_START=3399 /DNA_END=3906 /DNA_ORIENTATION=+
MSIDGLDICASPSHGRSNELLNGELHLHDSAYYVNDKPAEEIRPAREDDDSGGVHDVGSVQVLHDLRALLRHLLFGGDAPQVRVDGGQSKLLEDILVAVHGVQRRQCDFFDGYRAWEGLHGFVYVRLQNWTPELPPRHVHQPSLPIRKEPGRLPSLRHDFTEELQWLR